VLVPFGPSDFDDPHWWRRVDSAYLPMAEYRKWRPLRGRNEQRRVYAEREARALSVLVLAKARRILALEEGEHVATRTVRDAAHENEDRRPDLHQTSQPSAGVP